MNTSCAEIPSITCHLTQRTKYTLVKIKNNGKNIFKKIKYSLQKIK